MNGNPQLVTPIRVVAIFLVVFGTILLVTGSRGCFADLNRQQQIPGYVQWQKSPGGLGFMQRRGLAFGSNRSSILRRFSVGASTAGTRVNSTSLFVPTFTRR